MTVQVRGRGDGNTWGLQLLMERRVEQFDGGGGTNCNDDDDEC